MNFGQPILSGAREVGGDAVANIAQLSALAAVGHPSMQSVNERFGETVCCGTGRQREVAGAFLNHARVCRGLNA